MLSTTIKGGKNSVPVSWDPTYGVWGRVCEESLMTYAHLLIGIYWYIIFNITQFYSLMVHLFRWSKGKLGGGVVKEKQLGYVVDAKQIVAKKTHGTAASHAGFQMKSYIQALNHLIKHGVSIYYCIFVLIYLSSIFSIVSVLLSLIVSS